MLQKNFEFSINNNFSTIISNCANREETWINKSIENIYNKLHVLGYAHSIEVWEEKVNWWSVWGSNWKSLCRKYVF